MAGLARLIASNKIDILRLVSMSESDIKMVSKELCLKGISKKSNVNLLEEIKFIVKMYEAGQGITRFGFSWVTA